MGYRCARLLGAVAVLSWSSHAWADDLGTPIEPSDEKVRLVYEAPPACPDRAALLEGVRARIGSEWEAPEGELARQIDVRVTERGGRFVATVEFFDADGQRVTRSVGGEQCRNVVNGIALVTALAIESRVDEVLDQSEPVTTPAPPPPPTVAPVRPPPPRRPVGHPPRGEAVGSPLRAGARGVGVTGVGPELSLGAGFFAGAAIHGLRAGFAIDIVRSSRVERNGIPANYALTTGRLEAGLGLWPIHGVGLEALVFLEAGSMSAETSKTPLITEPGDGSVLFVAPGVLARGLTEVGSLLLGLEVMGRFPLQREEFGVNIGSERLRAYRVRPFSAGGALLAGVRF